MYKMLSLLVILYFFFDLTLSDYRLSWFDYTKINHLKDVTMAKNLYRRKIYLENLAKIEEHNDKFRKGLVSYSMKMNEFGDFDENEFSEKYTGLSDAEDDFSKRNGDDFYSAPENVTLPAAVDWRLQGAVSPVKRQSGCSACYAFAVVGMIESYYYINSKKLIDLSEQEIIDCGENYTLFGCKGGLLSKAFQYVVDIGLTTESKYPYEALTGPCRLDEAHRTSKVKIKSFKQIRRKAVRDMEAAVAFEGPVTAPVNGQVIKFISGQEILTGNWCVSRKVTHAVTIVGYNTTPEGLDYWIIKNSWGESWGDQGYFYVERNEEDLCGLTRQTFIPYLN